MIQANVHQAKTQLSKLIERAEAGEEVVIARNGKAAVRLEPVRAESASTRRRNIVGCMAGEVLSLSAEETLRLNVLLALELTDTSKFDVELDDGLEFIPATRP